MTVARNTVVLTGTEGSYHIVTRCVRRAFICGYDSLTGKDYSHRKLWIRDRLQELGRIFAVDICGYSVMSNHLHLVIRNRPDICKAWSDLEAAERWWRLYPKRRDDKGIPAVPTDSELEAIIKVDKANIEKDKTRAIRHRLGNISWFMARLNDHIAKRANKEDKCTGRFWEGRFKCQALLDEAAELACMAYVDLNPVRAKVADTPEESDFTSVKDRIDSRQARKKIKELTKARKSKSKLSKRQLESIKQEKAKSKQDRWLNPIGTQSCNSRRKGFLSLTRDEYLSLVDWTGRCIKEGKRGAIPANLEPILKRLNIDTNNWVKTVLKLGRSFYRVVGTIEKITERARAVGQAFFKGMSASREAFCST